MTYPFDSRAHTEWAVAIDCAKNGCEPPHSDDGWVSAFVESSLPDLLEHYGKDPKINNHAATIMWREIPAFQRYEADQ